jgi:long-chain-alcohol oxidase
MRVCSIDYTMASDDTERLLDGQEKMLRILYASGLAKQLGTMGTQGRMFVVPADRTAGQASFEEFLRVLRQDGLHPYQGMVFSAHQMGTCRMASTPELGAVKPTGETWDVKNLYVADASLFPTALGINPMITVEMLAFLVARHVAERARDTLGRGMRKRGRWIVHSFCSGRGVDLSFLSASCCSGESKSTFSW